MRRGLALVLIAGCGGYGVPITPGRLTVRLVRCTAALPPPGTDPDPVLATIGGDAPRRTPGWGTIAPAKPGAPPPLVFGFGTPSITGALTASAIGRVLQARQVELQACATKEAQAIVATGAIAKSIVPWRFTVGATGKVIFVDVTSTLSASLTTCVTSVVRGASFPVPADGRVVQVVYPFIFDATGTRGEVVAPKLDNRPRAWTPFALDAAPQPGATADTARATEGALRRRLGAIDDCFTGSKATGSLRAMLGIDVAGELASIRIGGLGDAAVERCVAKALTGTRVIVPRSDAAEIACDLSRGDARPWRVTVDADYGVIAATGARLRYGDRWLARGEEPTTLDEHKTFVIVVEPDTSGGMMSLALAWAFGGDGALIALRAPGAALFLGIGRTATTQLADGDGGAGRPALQLGAVALTACAGRARQQARLADVTAVDALIQRLGARCRAARCTSSLVIALAADALARDLVEVTAAARRAGFERVLIGGEAGCEEAAQR